MAVTIRDRLARSAITAIVGREAELSVLMAMLEAGKPLVTHLHGLSGIGKSALVDLFAAAARTRGAASSAHWPARCRPYAGTATSTTTPGPASADGEISHRILTIGSCRPPTASVGSPASER